MPIRSAVLPDARSLVRFPSSMFILMPGDRDTGPLLPMKQYNACEQAGLKKPFCGFWKGTSRQ
jgi:hypothetical protein